MFKYFFRQKRETRGFTLIEMMVSVSIFVMVAFVITSTLISVANANRKAQELKLIMDNLNFSIQSMVLRMREGVNYTCGDSLSSLATPVVPGRDCADTGSTGNRSAIAFLDPSGLTIKYYTEVGANGLNHIIKSETNLNSLNVTSDEVDVTDLKFFVTGLGEDQKPGVIISVSGEAHLRSGGRSAFKLQTFVSQHN